MGEMLGEEGKHQVGALGISFELPPQQEPLCQELGVRELLLPCKGWRLRADALRQPSGVPVLAMGLLVLLLCLLQHQALVLYTDFSEPSYTGCDMPQQLNLGCHSSSLNTIKQLLPAGQLGQNRGSMWHCQQCPVGVSIAVKAWHRWMGNQVWTQGDTPAAQPHWCWASHVPLVPMGFGQSSGTGGRMRV